MQHQGLCSAGGKLQRSIVARTAVRMPHQLLQLCQSLMLRRSMHHACNLAFCCRIQVAPTHEVHEDFALYWLPWLPGKTADAAPPGLLRRGPRRWLRPRPRSRGGPPSARPAGLGGPWRLTHRPPRRSHRRGQPNGCQELAPTSRRAPQLRRRSPPSRPSRPSGRRLAKGRPWRLARCSSPRGSGPSASARGALQEAPPPRPRSRAADALGRSRASGARASSGSHSSPIR